MADADNKFMDLNTTTGKKVLTTPISTTSGAADGGKIVKTDPTTGQLDPSLIPGSEVFSAVASEAITAPALVHYFDDAGTLKVKKADGGSNQLACHAIALTSAAIDGDPITVQGQGKVGGFSGLTLGARQYLDDAVPGGTTESPITGSNKLHQFIGISTSATEIDLEIEDPIER